MGWLGEFFSSFDVVFYNWSLFWAGIQVTLKLAIFGSVVGFIIGTIAGLIRLSNLKLIRPLVIAYVEFIRGTPLMVQLLFIYFGLGFKSAEFAGMVALAINSGAYVSEIVRAGVQSIEKGQMEAARSLGMNYVTAMRYVIFPQAFRRIIPPLCNEFIILLKDSSLASVLPVMELTKAANYINTRTFAGFPIYLSLAVLYFLMTYTLSNIFGVVERRMSVSD
ncbi:MAG: amino acid ABC transporter permease [Dethiobacteria bacterium]|jgi:His/Glu/Gln/Arg/opine family amino acid ABC transporter permease subunit